jgi:hypothetical protein
MGFEFSVILLQKAKLKDPKCDLPFSFEDVEINKEAHSGSAKKSISSHPWHINGMRQSNVARSLHYYLLNDSNIECRGYTYSAK